MELFLELGFEVDVMMEIPEDYNERNGFMEGRLKVIHPLRPMLTIIPSLSTLGLSKISKKELKRTMYKTN